MHPSSGADSDKSISMERKTWGETNHFFPGTQMILMTTLARGIGHKYRLTQAVSPYKDTHITTRIRSIHESKVPSTRDVDVRRDGTHIKVGHAALKLNKVSMVHNRSR
jgi:hypothetical protein